MGADLANLINEAALAAARADKDAVQMADFDEALDRVVGGLERRSRLINPREKEIVAHHEQRLDRTEAALGSEPRSGYEVSHDLFGSELAPIQRRFAVAEALSHLERLVALERAERREDDRGVSYTGRSAGGRAPL